MDVLIGFGGLAVILTAIGFYGVMSYAVTRREREIGIRMALGESASITARSFLLQTGRVSAAGIGAGLVMAAALVRFIAGQLYGVAPTDPLSFGVAAGGLAVVAILATAGPVLTALRTDPLTAIRGD
jgi:ABC-type antimicrobial peptide transport system permease subunit